MQYLIIILGIAVTMILVGMVVWYALAAAAYYSQRDADSEYKDAIEDALPFEVSLAYVIWAMSALTLSYISDTFQLTPLMQIESGWYTLGAILLFGFSYLLVHVICVKLSKKYTILHRYSWLH